MRGRAGVEQLGRQTWVSPGAWTLYDTTGCYAVDNPERVEHLIVMLPKAQIMESGLRLDTLMARCLGGSSGIARVALTTMRSTYQELPHMSADAPRRASRTERCVEPGQGLDHALLLHLLDVEGPHLYILYA